MKGVYKNFMSLGLVCLMLFLNSLSFAKSPVEHGIRIKDLTRIQGIRENALVGYGIVIGLAGSGDSSRTKSTFQSIANTLIKFGVLVNKNDIQSRNVASVMVTANLPAFAEIGDSFDIQVSSIGDAKSLAGGTLLLTPLSAANGKTYALSQGSLSVGGYKYDAFGNLVQKNHPTVGIVTKGATVEKATSTEFFADGELSLILNEPDFTTANRVVKGLSQAFSLINVEAVNAGKIKVRPNKNLTKNQLNELIANIEKVTVSPDIRSKVVVNERTGTIVSGGNVKISAVSISHGNLKLQIDTQFQVSQPQLLVRPTQNISTQVVPDTDIKVSEEASKSVRLKDGIKVADLLDALKAINLSTRDTIIVLQAIKQAGALHADLIIQ